ncbi:MAG: DUF2202 domain-containing protein [Magnetococcus sp. WYHC-3]
MVEHNPEATQAKSAATATSPQGPHGRNMDPLDDALESTDFRPHPSPRPLPGLATPLRDYVPVVLMVLLLLLVLPLVAVFFLPPTAPSGGVTMGGQAVAVPAAALSVVAGVTPEEQADLVYMQEEEKLARDVYRFLYKTWGLTIFSSITASEERHVDAILGMVRRYGVPDLIQNSRDGEFNDQRLASLHDQLVAKGSLSRIDALEVGGLIEELDILDLEKALSRTSRSDIRTVYTHIQRGSFNHLRAFAHALEVAGRPYSRQKLNQQTFLNIIHSPMSPAIVSVPSPVVP